MEIFSKNFDEIDVNLSKGPGLFVTLAGTSLTKGRIGRKYK